MQCTTCGGIAAPNSIKCADHVTESLRVLMEIEVISQGDLQSRQGRPVDPAWIGLRPLDINARIYRPTH